MKTKQVLIEFTVALLVAVAVLRKFLRVSGMSMHRLRFFQFYTLVMFFKLFRHLHSRQKHIQKVIAWQVL